MKAFILFTIILLLITANLTSQTSNLDNVVKPGDSVRYYRSLRDTNSTVDFFLQYKIREKTFEKKSDYNLFNSPTLDIYKTTGPFQISSYSPTTSYRSSTRRVKRKSNTAWAENKKLSLLSFGIAASYRHQYYDNQMMNLFKGVSSFSLDLDLGVDDLIVTTNFAWGGGQLYDSLTINFWEWLPYTKVSTNTTAIFVAYPAINKSFGKISPFVGMQRIKLKLKPDFYMLSPVGLNNMLESKHAYSLGFHYDLAAYNYSYNGKFNNGFGLRFSYAWSIVKFEEFDGFMHQFTLGLYRIYRAARPK